MRADGLVGVRRGSRKRTTIVDPAAALPDDLVRRDFEPLAPNRLWVADLTYVSTWTGWVYVAFVIDAYARRILGWRVATTMTTSMVLDALEQAIWTRQCEGHDDFTALIAHTDHGRPVHLDPLQRTDRHRRDHPLGRRGRLELRQCAGRDHQRPLQDRSDPTPRPLARRRPRRTRHRRMGRLAQHQPPVRVLRRRPTGRAGERPLPSEPATNGGCIVKQPSLRNHRGDSPDRLHPRLRRAIKRCQAPRAGPCWRYSDRGRPERSRRRDRHDRRLATVRMKRTKCHNGSPV